jgi:hypothetical protein
MVTSSVIGWINNLLKRKPAEEATDSRRRGACAGLRRSFKQGRDLVERYRAPLPMITPHRVENAFSHKARGVPVLMTGRTFEEKALKG